ncbi:MAG TPA: hypothetical protein VH479_06310 [Acidimicrobiales bacterium]
MGGLRVLGSPPWRRAPLALVRRIDVLGAMAAATFVLVAVLAATPLFLSSAAGQAQASQIERECRFDAGATVNAFGQDTAGTLARTEKAFAGVPAAGEIVESTVSHPLILERADGTQLPLGRLIARSRVGQHVSILDGDATGVMLPDTFAAREHLGVGAQIGVVGASGKTRELPITGVYRDLATAPIDGWWCTQVGRIQQPNIFVNDGVPPPPLLLTTPEALRAMRLGLGPPEEATVEVAVRTHGVSYDDGTELIARLDPLTRQQALNFIEPQVFQPTSTTPVQSELPDMHARASALSKAVGHAIAPLVAAGVIAAILLVAAAGGFWVDRQRAQVRMLAARGVGPVMIGLKAALETSPGVLAGTVLGWVACRAAIGALGPGAAIDTAAVRRSLVAAVVGAGVAAVLLSVAAGLRARQEEAGRVRGPRRIGTVVRLLPLELVPLVLAAVAFAHLRTHPPKTIFGIEVPTLDVLGLAFPLLLVAGAVMVAMRVARWALRAVRPRARHWGDSAYLATARLSGNARASVLLLAAVGVSVATLAYAAVVTNTLSQSLEAKARVAFGSDVAASLIDPHQVPPALEPHSTTVAFEGPLTLGDHQVQVLAIDLDTFGRAAFWQDRFAAKSLPALLRDIRSRAGAAAVPALAVGPMPSIVELDLRAGQPQRFQVVDRAKTFPGALTRPTLVVDRKLLDQLDLQGDRQLWVKGDATKIADTLDRARVPYRYLRRGDQALASLAFVSVRWTFGFLLCLGFVAGALSVAGMLLYLDARQRALHLAYTMARRMGLTRRAHRRSLLLEVAAVLGSGALVGAAVATAAAVLAYRRLDPLPNRPPGTFLAVPWVLPVGLVVALAAVALAGAAIAQRGADRADPEEVLRLGG